MPLSSDDPFLCAITAYQAKEPEAAAIHCRAILKDRPDHAACLHLLGVIEYGFGRKGEAEGLMRRAIELKPGFAEIHYSFAQVLLAQGKYEEAVEQYRITLALKPEHAEACFHFGNTLNLLHRPDEAAKAYAQAIKARPDFPEALNNLGVYYFEKANFSEAERLESRALELQPDYAAALNNLGNVYKAQKKWDRAIDCYRRALALKPDLWQAMNNMGLALLYGASDFKAAASCFTQILAQDPNHVPALTHLGIVFCMQGEFAKGDGFYQKALALDPAYFDALNNRGNALKALGRVDEAIVCYENALTTRPNDPEIHNNLAMALLLAGRLKEGWIEYEWRWKTVQLAPAERHFPQPLWRGEEALGRTLLIHAEQGFGDTLQFCRYAPLAAQRGWRVILQVQPELLSLIGGMQGIEKVIGMNEKLPDFDMHCPMMNLPQAFATRIDTILANVPYLFADDKKAAVWRERLCGDEGLKVGLVWTGNPRLFSLDLAAANARRSLPPDSLAPLAGLAGVRFYSLQKNGFALSSDLGLIDYMPECRDFSDTAALIANLDLVISVDTAVAHLAGALGKPVWLLNRFDTCWRWLLNRDDSPWYPTLRLFRQPESGDWASVVERVRGELKRLIDKV
ncbi:MAG: tetratricopeptide repeat protein [Alphaproteobacteria bacterium]|nr:tetratricopeptide repeat protein [Alphaproteobacteria bacterium]